MTLSLLFLMSLIAVCCAWRGWRRAAYGVGGAVLLLILLIGCGPLPGWLLTSLQAGAATYATGGWGARSGIVLLGGGTEKVADSGAVETSPLVYGRLVKALDLYLACKRAGGDCFILASGGDPRGYGTSEAAVFGAQLRRLGVVDADLVLEEKSLNTWQNAQFSASLLKARKAERVYLVTSGLHLRRSQLYFQHFGVQASPIRADYARAVMSAIPLAYNLLLMDFALHEYTGNLRYSVYQALGWNVTASGAGAL